MPLPYIQAMRHLCLGRHECVIKPGALPSTRMLSGLSADQLCDGAAKNITAIVTCKKIPKATRQTAARSIGSLSYEARPNTNTHAPKVFDDVYRARGIFYYADEDKAVKRLPDNTMSSMVKKGGNMPFLALQEIALADDAKPLVGINSTG